MLKLSEQNRLYDKIETVTAHQLARIQEYLIALKHGRYRYRPAAAEAHRHFGNLYQAAQQPCFVCDKAEDIDTTELRLSLFESAESLR